MSVMAAHFVELREDETLDVCVVLLALHSVPGACGNDRLLYQSDDAETKLRHLELVATWFLRRLPHATHRLHKDQIGTGSACLWPFSLSIMR